MIVANGTGRIFTGGKITGDSYVTLPKAQAILPVFSPPQTRLSVRQNALWSEAAK